LQPDAAGWSIWLAEDQTACVGIELNASFTGRLAMR
jgi:NADH:ubiquinone oxidoreductase subunit B-like Fe-S oxidoreductase